MKIPREVGRRELLDPKNWSTSLRSTNVACNELWVVFLRVSLTQTNFMVLLFPSHQTGRIRLLFDDSYSIFHNRF